MYLLFCILIVVFIFFENASSSFCCVHFLYTAGFGKSTIKKIRSRYYKMFLFFFKFITYLDNYCNLSNHIKCVHLCIARSLKIPCDVSCFMNSIFFLERNLMQAPCTIKNIFCRQDNISYLYTFSILIVMKEINCMMLHNNLLCIFKKVIQSVFGHNS